MLTDTSVNDNAALTAHFYLQHKAVLTYYLPVAFLSDLSVSPSSRNGRRADAGVGEREDGGVHHRPQPPGLGGRRHREDHVLLQGGICPVHWRDEVCI